MVRLRGEDTEERWSEGFTSRNDVFQRKDLADRLSNLYGSLEQGSVALLDGPWGVGKSTFVKMWRQMLKERGIPSVYVDGFAQDYISDPFEALCGTFVQAAGDAGKQDTDEYRVFANRAVGVGKRLLPTIAKVAVKAATVGLIGSSEIEAVQTAVDASADAVSDAVEDRLKQILAGHAEANNSFEALRIAIMNLVRAIDPSESSDKPARLVIIIDELDRCRPIFAVGLLEIIKHFFRAESVHFLIVTNRASLTRSFAAVHNLGDEANDYLSKFYDFIINLDLSFDSYGKQYLRQYIAQTFSEIIDSPKTQFSHSLEEMCLTLSVAHGLSLRQINTFVLSASLCVNALKGKREMSSMLVAHLILMKIIRPELYASIKLRNLVWSDMRQIIPAGLELDDYNSEHVYNMFGYFLVKDVNEVPEDYRKLGYSDRLGLSREGVLPYLANSVVDLLAQPTPPQQEVQRH